mgnify:CR=1 FL=1
MSKAKALDFSPETMIQLCEILNRGNQAEVKKEKDNIVVVEINRHARIKTPIQ